MTTTMKTEACIFPECKRDQGNRGLCNNHRMAAAKLITAGRTSWAKLEAAGKALPARERSKVVRWFLDDAKKVVNPPPVRTHEGPRRATRRPRRFGGARLRSVLRGRDE